MIQQIQLALMIYDLGLASDAALAAPADEATAATAKLHTQIEAWGTDPAKAVGLPEAAFTMPLALMNYDLGRRAFAEHPDCDAIYIGGGAWIVEPWGSGVNPWAPGGRR